MGEYIFNILPVSRCSTEKKAPGLCRAYGSCGESALGVSPGSSCEPAAVHDDSKTRNIDAPLCHPSRVTVFKSNRCSFYGPSCQGNPVQYRRSSDSLFLQCTQRHIPAGLQSSAHKTSCWGRIRRFACNHTLLRHKY